MVFRTFTVLLALSSCSCQAERTATPTQSNSNSWERKESYTGTELSLQSSLQCKSDQLASGGFWRTGADAIEQGGRLGRESRITTWRITIQEKIAEVARFSGATQTLDEPQLFNVERTSGGLLLTSTRQPGESLQIITIDPSSSSFVYSSQHVSPLSNRANIFYGTCQAYP
jgi:hypothetical protein